MSRHGSRRILTMPSGCDPGARWPKRCMRATIPSPTSRCRSGWKSNGWCESRAGGWLARSPRPWWRSLPAAAPAGWRMAWRLRRRRSRVFTGEALVAHRLYVVEVRHPVEVPGSERAHLQTWLTKRCGWVVLAPELDATGLKLVGGRLLPGPTGPASFLMYEAHRANVLRSTPPRRTPRRRRCVIPRRTRTARCSGPIAAWPCGQRQQRPRPPDPGGAAGLRRNREEWRVTAYCEELVRRSPPSGEGGCDEAIHVAVQRKRMDCFASLAMTL